MTEELVMTMDSGIVVDFLKGVLPFSELDEAALRKLARGCTVDFAPKGTLLQVQGLTEVDSLCLIQKGGVRLFVRDDDNREVLLDFRGEGDTLGGLAMLQGGKARTNAETVEDTFFFRCPKVDFLDLVKTHPAVAQHYLKTFSETYVTKVFDELRTRRGCLESEGGLYLFSAKVAEMMHGVAVTVPMGKSIQEAAAIMIREGVGSLLVTDPSQDVIGIVTDKDLRKFVALGMNFSAPIETIMTSPVQTVRDGDICFDALIKMMTTSIHHLAVEREGKVVGMVTSHDIMVLQGKSPMTLFREIVSQQRIEGLYPLGDGIPKVVRTLVEEGAKAENITRLITVLNDLIVNKILTLMLKELGPPPLPFCWLLMGSEGRREQTFKTDQDNALIVGDTQDDIIRRAGEIYFEAFTERAIRHLERCGFPPCPGKIMASNPKWRQPFSLWRDRFERWIAVPEPEEVMHAAIFFDFRPGFGHAPFAESLRNHLAAHCGREDVFLRYLAANCLETRPPLSFFRNFIVEKDGEHKDRLDIKIRGLAPIVDFARVLSLKHGIRETNTLARLRQLEQGGHISTDLFTETSQAYGFMMQLRLVHQLELAEQGKPPNNHIAPHALSELEKRTLKEAFGVIGHLQTFLKDLFKLNVA